MANTLRSSRNGAAGFINWLGVRVMQKQGHRGVVNDRPVIGQNVRPDHALHTRRSLRDESFVHVRKIDSVNTITEKRVTIQRKCHAVQRMYRQLDAPGSASKLASVACRNTLRPAIGKIDDRLAAPVSTRMSTGAPCSNPTSCKCPIWLRTSVCRRKPCCKRNLAKAVV